MKRNNKKGFTIVELVIVIAVIAILAAVLIPTFSSVIKKAKVNNDIQLIHNLNTAVASTAKKPETMHDAIEAAKDFGYDLPKIKASAIENEILWDSVNNVFCYLKDGEIDYIPNSVADGEALKKDDYRLWQICDTKPGTQTYSIYAGSNWTATTVEDLAVGFDAGDKAVEQVTYVGGSDKHVTIRTNNDNAVVTVNNEAAEVDIYGKAGTVKVGAAAQESVHVFGEVAIAVEVTKGHVVLESGANVSAIMPLANTAKVTVNAGANYGGVAIIEGVTATLEGVAEDKKVSTNEATLSKFAGGLGTKESPYLIATEEQFANINSLDFSKPYYFAQTANLNVSTFIYDFAGGYDGRGHSITSNYIYDNNKEFGWLFYRIVGHATFSNIKVVMNSTHATALLESADMGTAYGADFTNIEFTANNPITCNSTNFGFVIIEPIYTIGSNDVVYNFKDITSDVNLTNASTCTSLIIGSGPCFNTNTTLNYENCVNNGIITGTSYVGFLYGNPSYIASMVNGKIVVKNCHNNGVLMSVSDNAIVALAPNYAECNEQYQSIVGGSYVTGNYLTNKEFTVNQTGKSFTINTTDTTVTYKLVLSVGSTFFTKDGSAWTDAHTEDIQKNINDRKLTDVANSRKYMIDLTVNAEATGACNTFKAYDKRTAVKEGIIAEGDKIDYNANGLAIVVKDGINCVIFDCEADTYINSGVTLYVYAYNADGTMVGMKAL